MTGEEKARELAEKHCTIEVPCPADEFNDVRAELCDRTGVVAAILEAMEWERECCEQIAATYALEMQYEKLLNSPQARADAARSIAAAIRARSQGKTPRV